MRMEVLRGKSISMIFRATIQIKLKESVNDPQGNAVLSGLKTLGFDSVENVRIGKFIVVTLHARNRSNADSQVNDMCAKLLANTVIESFDYVLEDVVN